MRYVFASAALSLLVVTGHPVPIQQGMIPVIDTAPAGTVINPCLISAWPMNEGSGVTLHDTSPGGTNTATVNNIANITWGSHAGFPGSSISWSASGLATATSTTLTNFTGTTPFSISAWATTGAGGSEVYTSSMASIASQQGWLFWHHNIGAGNDQLEFRLVNTYPTNAIEVHGSNTIPPGTFLYAVVTYDGSQTAAGVKLYANASLTTNVVVNNSLSLTAANGLAPAFNAMRNGDLGAGQTMGYVEIYNCVLTPTQISTYNTAGPGIY